MTEPETPSTEAASDPDGEGLATPVTGAPPAMAAELEAALAADAAVTPTDRGADDDDADRRHRALLAGWAYLAVLFVVFLAVAFFAFDRSDDDTTVDAGATTTTVTEVQLTPVALTFVVENDTVTLQGAVPDEGARQQLVALAEARYGAGNVVDQLTIDGGTTIEGGTISVSGTAVAGDPDPEGLQADFATLGLEAGGFDVTFTELEVTPVTAEARVATTTVTLVGSFPDQASLDQFVLAAESTFGAGNVDPTGLVVDPDTTLTNSTIIVTGLIDAGDTRGQEFEAALQQFFGGSQIDSTGLQVDTSAEALARLETRLRETLQANPIVFESGSAEIDPASDAVIQLAAVAINATPGVNVEIVGHTDDQGDAGTNQLLSEDRANAVLDRLVELGVDPARLTARGAGEAEPIADNSTEEGRAANRRIEFEFEGAAEPADEATDGDADESSG